MTIWQKFAPKKFQAMTPFTTSYYKKLIKREPLIFDGIETKWSTNVKYLSVMLDENMNFKKQISNTINSVEKSIWRLQNHANSKNGCDPRTMEMIFNSYILPFFLWGSCVWIFKIKKSFQFSSKPVNGHGKLWNSLTCLQFLF